MTVYPKATLAAVGGTLGVLIGAVLHSIPGVSIAPEVYAAVPAFLSTLGAWLAPSPPA